MNGKAGRLRRRNQRSTTTRSHTKRARFYDPLLSAHKTLEHTQTEHAALTTTATAIAAAVAALAKTQMRAPHQHQGTKLKQTYTFC